MNLVLLISAVIIFICIFLNKISDKLGIPVLLAFILLGMAFGSDGIFKIPYNDYISSEKICSAALIFIMFYGGFGTKWDTARPVAAKSIILSSLGVVLTAAFTGLFCFFILKIKFIESMLIGALLGSTDAASVFSILRSKRLALRYNTSPLLELESGSNDPFAYMLTIIIISVINGTANKSAIAYMLFAQVVYGIVIGAAIAAVTLFILKRINFTSNGFETIFVFAVAVVAYALPSLLGGNGYLSTYIVGIILGNSNINNKKPLVSFFDGINGLMQILIFFLLGLLSFPSKIPDVLITSLFISLFLTFVSRPLAVFSILSPFKSKLSQQLIVSWCGLRGAASIVFSVIAIINVKTENDIFHIIFCVVLFSILIQGSLLPLFAKKLNMIDTADDVLKTFTDYSDEVPVQFVKFTITDSHKWCNEAIKDIILPPDTIFVLLMRGNEQIIPNGNTVILNNDVLILCAPSTDKINGVCFIERNITSGDKFIGKTLSEIKKHSDILT